MSILGAIGGLVFIGIGVTVVTPQTGSFGVLWTGVAVVITIYHLVNAFSRRGIAEQVVDIEEQDSLGGAGEARPIAARLRELEDLRAEALITPAEYEARRRAILAEV
jgi:hypothetical protein